MKARIYSLIITVLFILSCTSESTSPTIDLSQPESLTIFQSAITQFKLNWIDNSTNENGYKVQRKLDDGEWDEITSLPENTEYYQDDISGFRQTYYHVSYRIFSYEGNINSDFAEVDAEIIFPAPTDLEFDMIYWSLSWTDNSLGEEGFLIERSVNGSEFDEFLINEPNLNGTIIFDVENYTDYAYRVNSFVGDFYSDYTNLIQFTTDQSHFHADFIGDQLHFTGVTQAFVQFSDITMIYYSPVVAWDWDFGNGQTSDQKNPRVLYLSPGKYTVSLTITTEGGSQDTMIKEDYISIEYRF